MSELTTALIAVIVSVGLVAGIFVGANLIVDRLSDRQQNLWRPVVFVLPAALFLTGWLVIPAIRTVYISFFDRRSEEFVGFENYTWAFTTDSILTVFRNNIFWLIGVTFFSTAFGLLLAVLADRMKSERAAKSFIFLPMAVSFVGASVVWRFVYAFKPAGQEQIGLLNAIWSGLGGDPVAWLIQEPWNNFFLIIIMIWIQTGFAMVVLSAAIKGVPTDLLEAARVDGATEVQTFWRITIPSIKGTIAVVATTTIILVLKVYDIVKVTTNGNFNTNVIANEMFEQSFRFRETGRGAALASILFLAIIPMMIVNVHRFRREEAMR
ncbi:MAG TPA: sugar ABC transporter permease [Acidimicrobiales bacterium]|nr:sugar ABC transporter permease [Acidimicrobiales bacterium]